jgi:hypothetical protein
VIVPDSFVERCVDALYCCKKQHVVEEAAELPKKKIPAMKDQVKVESVVSQKSIKTTNNEMTNLEVHRERSETSSKNLLIDVSVVVL